MAPRPPPTRARLALGFLVAPLAVPLLDGAVELGLPHGPSAGYLRLLWTHASDAAVSWTTPIAYGFALAVGVPVVLALRGAGRLTAPWLVGASAAGAAAGCAAQLALIAAGGIVHFGQTRWIAAPAVAALLAALVAGAFCAVAGVPLRRRARAAREGVSARRR